MTKLFKSINISLIAAIIMIIATALNFAQEVRFSTIMPTGAIAGGNIVRVRGVLGVLGNPVGGWAPSGNDWQTYNPLSDCLMVGSRLSVRYSNPSTLTANFAVDGTARIADDVTLGQNLDVGSMWIWGNLDVTSDISAAVGINAQSMNVGVLFANFENSGRIDINGQVWQYGGVNQLHDYVFEPDYKLEPIEKHAKFMWKEKRLPAIPLAEKTDDGRYGIEIGAQQGGILAELEKAHIYITQLKKMLDGLKKRITRLENKYD